MEVRTLSFLPKTGEKRLPLGVHLNLSMDFINQADNAESSIDQKEATFPAA